MLPHPLTESFSNKVVGIVLIVAAIAIQSGLLMLYADMPSQIALTDSFITVGILAIGGFMMWYAMSFISVWQAHILIALILQFICLGVSFSVLYILGMKDPYTFMISLPLRLLLGILGWIILIQWYWQLQKADKIETELVEREIIETEAKEILDRISVKDGARIHIIHLEELHCIQASGDYVNLITSSGQYIKEQTMKYFELNLPPTMFVRIHRSSIVNTEHIMRVELFGKETYQVRLKNGMSLRASNSGYKLLKERLSL